MGCHHQHDAMSWGVWPHVPMMPFSLDFSIHAKYSPPCLGAFLLISPAAHSVWAGCVNVFLCLLLLLRLMLAGKPVCSLANRVVLVQPGDAYELGWTIEVATSVPRALRRGGEGCRALPSARIVERGRGDCAIGLRSGLDRGD